MKNSLKGAAAVVAAATMLYGAPAFAQKAKDTLRAVSEEPVSIIDDVFNAQPFTRQITQAIFDQLAFFDWQAKKWVPGLAESWKMIDDSTIEYTLRPGIKYHNGETMTAQDFVDKFNLVVDPKVLFRFKESRYGFMKNAEATGPLTFRVYANGPTGTLIARTANMQAYPGKMFLEQKEAFGKAPVGTGPYKAVQVDTGKGVVLAKYDGFQIEGPARPKGKIGRIEISSAPDRQTQLARMMVGDQDFMFNVNVDQAEDMVKNPMFKLFVTDVPSFSYLQFDVANRSGIGVLKDERVRMAMAMAINREKIKQNLMPKDAQNIPLPDGLCEKALIACQYSAKLPGYDPAKAKELLKQAGQEGGFEVTLTGWGAVKDLITAVAGDLRAVGIKAKENYVNYATYTKMRQEGQFQGLISYYDNAGSQPDVESTVDFFYLPSERDYFQDKSLHDLAGEAHSITNDDKRAAIYQKIFDTAVQKMYVMPLLQVPSIVVYNKDIVLEGGHKSPEGYWFNYIDWAK